MVSANNKTTNMVPIEQPNRSTSLASSPSQPRFAGVEGLRAVAAVSILVWHCYLYAAPEGERVRLGPLIDFAFTLLPAGVILFFTLSGFLLYRPFADAILKGKSLPSLGQYLHRRAFRILPAYWVILLITGIVLQAALLRNPDNSLRTGSLLDAPELLQRNLALVQNYSPSSLLSGIGPAWSLAVEAVFYLVLPLLALLAFAIGRRTQTHKGRRMAALAPAGIVFVIGLGGKLAATYLVLPGTGPSPGWDADWHSVLERSFLAQADLFTFGMILAVISVEVDAGRLRLPSRWYPAAAAAVVAIVLPSAVSHRAGLLDLYVYDTLMALACASLLALVILDRPRGGRSGWLVRLLDSRPLVMAGVASYSLFLWHEPLIRWLQSQGLTLSGNYGFLGNLILVGAVSGLAAAATYRFVERPMIQLGRRYPRPERNNKPSHPVRPV